MKSDNCFRLPDTGITRCFNSSGQVILPPEPGQPFFGQDGCFTVHPLSFSKLGFQGEELNVRVSWEDGTRAVRDNNTGLIWEIKSPDKHSPNYYDDVYSWQEAQEVYITRLNEQGYGGFKDWRVPRKDELRSIVDYSQLNPAVDSLFFPLCQTAFYWTAQTYEMQPYFGWGIFFGLGSGIAFAKSSRHYVRAVRGGYNTLFGEPDPSRFQDNDDGTITDTVTGLMWQKEENQRMNWAEAMKNCEKMTLAGHSDWRLPNIKELNTILNLRYTDGWWYYRDFFPAKDLQPPLLHYFSSTPHENYYVWVTNFCFGYDGYYANKNAPLLHRAVRTIASINPAPMVFSFPDSGQRDCYDDEGNRIETPADNDNFYGQDGCYCINPLSFTGLRNEERELEEKAGWEQGLRMVKDRNTGLVWEIKSPDPGDLNYLCRKYTWDEANSLYIAQMNEQRYGGCDDWRLPNKEELRSIVTYDGSVPAIDRAFLPGCLPAFYWSADEYGADKNLGWGIYFGYGCGICYLKSMRYNVRAVRSGINRSFGNIREYSFVDNGDGTISDVNTGLMWKKGESPEMNFRDALHYCEHLSLAGHTDWRLPNIKELATLLDLSFKDSIWFHRLFFPDVITKPLGFYWASTTFGESFAWGINFQFGYDGYYAGKKHGKYPFRPVRTIAG